MNRAAEQELGEETGAAGPLSVGVAVDIEYGPNAGGHIRSWEKFAEAAMALPDALDLTVYMLSAGKDVETRDLAANVRFVLLPPRMGTRRLGLQQGAGHTDLAPWHPAAGRAMVAHDLLHITSAFALSRTAARVARIRGKALTGSIQTDLPAFTRVYTGELIGRVFGRRGRALLDRAGLNPAGAFAALMRRRVRRLYARCDFAFYSNARNAEETLNRLPPDRTGPLDRGIDKEFFHPGWRDRAALAERFGLDPEAVVLLFVGRVDASKNVMCAARAAAALVEKGLDVRFFAAGEGAEREAVRALLGDRATAPGGLDQQTLAQVYASADIFVFPSLSETFGNVVQEARASGLPVAVPHGTRPAALVREAGVDGLVIDGIDPGNWAAAIEPLVRDAAARRAMGEAARRDIEANALDWAEVLETELLPVWRRLAAQRPAVTRASSSGRVRLTSRNGSSAR